MELNVSVKYVNSSGDVLVNPDLSDKLITPVVIDGEECYRLDDLSDDDMAARESVIADGEERAARLEDALDAPDAIADLSETVSDNAVDVSGVGDALADLSETVSDNAVDVSALSDAIAELSQLVSDLANKEA